MELIEKLILLRAGDRKEVEKKDSPLSEIGKDKIKETFKKILPFISKNEVIEMYCPNSKSAIESSEIIIKKFEEFGIKIRDFKKDDRLFSDALCSYDPEWIKEEIDNTTAKTIIIVGYIELVRWFPKDLGLPKNYAKAGEGILLTKGKITEIVLDEI